MKTDMLSAGKRKDLQKNERTEKTDAADGCIMAFVVCGLDGLDSDNGRVRDWARGIKRGFFNFEQLVSSFDRRTYAIVYGDGLAGAGAGGRVCDLCGGGLEAIA